MRAIAVRVVYRAFDTNQRSECFLRWLIIGLAVAGFVFGVLAYYISGFLALVEIFIVPTLIRAIRAYVAINENNASILSRACETLRGARKQTQIERKIRREIQAKR